MTPAIKFHSASRSTSGGLKLSSLLPSNRNRSLLVHTLVKQFGLLASNYSSSSKLQVVHPTPADLRDLTAYHDREFIEHLMDDQVNSGGSGGSEYGLEEVGASFV